MAGKRKKLESKIAKKEDQPRMKKKKIDLTKEKEKVKFLSSVLAEQVSVQEELMEHMNTQLDHEPSDNQDTHQDLLLTYNQLRNVNRQAVELHAAIEDYFNEMLAVLEAEESKGK